MAHPSDITCREAFILENVHEMGVGEEVVSNVPDVSNDAYVVRYIRRTWPWTYDDSIEMSE